LTRLSTTADIWKRPLEDVDIQRGIDYGIISRAWTYDRMGAQARGDLTKAAFRPAVGVAVQHAFERVMKDKYNIRFIRDTHDFKEEDYWDISSKSGKKVDVKSFHVFTDYADVGRPELSKSLIINSSTGQKWSTFFPMLIPRDQFESEEPKDYYVFAILLARSSKPFPAYINSAKYLVAIPFSNDRDMNLRYQRIHRRRYADQRMRSGLTFSLNVKRVGQAPIVPRPSVITIGYGDKEGKAVRHKFRLQVGQRETICGLTAFHFLRIHETPREEQDARILELTFRDVDEEGDIIWHVSWDSFRDIWIHDAMVYFIGWISRNDFDEIRQTRKAYGPRSDWQGNTDHDDPAARGLLSRRVFCYYYPPTFRGGLQTHNYYCLPRDLNRMSSLPELLR